MGRALIIVRGALDRRRAAMWAVNAPEGTRIEFKAGKRTLPQNDRMWAMLTEVAQQATHNGRKFTADQWKTLFMHACGREVLEFIPALDGQGFIPWGQRSSDLSKAEMSELIDFIQAWGAQNGVTFQERAA